MRISDWSSDVCSSDLDDQVRAMLQRLLPERPQKGVVDDDRRPAYGVGVEGVTRFRNGGDVDKLVGGVGRAFQIDAADTTASLRPPARGVDLLSGSACRKNTPMQVEPAQGQDDPRYGSCVNPVGRSD